MFVTKIQSYKDNFFKACPNFEFFPLSFECLVLEFFQNVEKKAEIITTEMNHTKPLIPDVLI